MSEDDDVDYDTDDERYITSAYVKVLALPQFAPFSPFIPLPLPLQLFTSLPANKSARSTPEVVLYARQ